MRHYRLKAKTDNRENDKGEQLNSYVEPPIPRSPFDFLQGHGEALEKQNQRNAKITD